MNHLNTLLAVAGVTVTLLVVVAMVLITPRGAVPARRAEPQRGGATGPLTAVEET